MRKLNKSSKMQNKSGLSLVFFVTLPLCDELTLHYKKKNDMPKKKDGMP